MVEKSRWTAITEENPDHSAWYIQRFIDMEAEGRDLHGEARFVDAMVGRGARILDAGCGPGRVGGRLAVLGHECIGVDVDPILIDAAKQSYPGATWITADLADLDPSSIAPGSGFDVIVAAGNVMAFLAASTRRMVLSNLQQQLGPQGRLIVGFGTGRDYEFDDFFDDVGACGLTSDVALSSWDLRPFDQDSEFLVAVLSST